jgi:enoyl-[acyl-carrier protein] reductase I
MLAGRVGVVVGVANKNSLAWAVAKAWHAAGASVLVTCQGPRFLPRLEGLVQAAAKERAVASSVAGAADGTASPGGQLMAACCDVAQDAEIEQLFDEHVGGNAAFRGSLDMVFHSIAHAPTAALKGSFLDTTREDFLAAHDIRCAAAASTLSHRPATPPLSRSLFYIVTGRESQYPHSLS